MSEGIVKRPWKSITIRFLFSAPATWDSKLVETFKALASQAGFAKCEEHDITVSLTEPEAVAAFELFEKKFDFPVLVSLRIIHVSLKWTV